MRLYFLLLPLLFGTYRLKGGLLSSTGGTDLQSAHFRSNFSSGVGIAGRSNSSTYRETAGILYYIRVFYPLPWVDEGIHAPSLVQGLRTLWPNPSKGRMSILYGARRGDRVKVEIFDIAGRLVYRETFTENSGGMKTFQMRTNLASGIYILRFDVAGKIANRKIVVMR